MGPKLAHAPAAMLLSMSASMWCHVITTFHVTATSNYMLSLPSTSSPCQQPRHPPCHRCVTCNWICDENYTVCDVYFRHRKWAWVGLRAPGDILWRFRNVMDQAIYDENLRNVTRCDLWRSIHDAIWDRHRYCFMTVFSDLWRNLNVMYH